MHRFLLILSVIILGISCSKTTLDENNSQTPYAEYYSLQVGQAYLYRLDSTVLLSFGSDTITKTYLLKDSVMKVSTDLSGAITYRVNTYIQSYTANDDWQYQTSYDIIPKTNTLEMVDSDNLRFIKLASPVSNGFSWDGNAYFIKGAVIGSDSTLFKYINWSYQYTDINQPITLMGNTFDSTITVTEKNDSSGIFVNNAYYSRQLAKETYAKGEGLIHRKFLFLTWQANAGYESTSYGIELTRIR